MSVLERGGIKGVAQASAVSRRAMHVGLQELSDLKEPVENPPKRIRKEGAGRKPVIQTDVGLMSALEKLVEPMTRGDPESPLHWTCKSPRTLAGEIAANGHRVSYLVVGDLLHELGYSLKAN